MKKARSILLAMVMCLSLLPMSALAADTITVTLNPESGGSVTGGGKYPIGSTVTVTATPNTDYDFNGWYENSYNGFILVSSSATYTFTAGNNYAGIAVRNLFARFELQPPPPPAPQTYTIYAYASGGSVSGDGEYTHGSTVRLSFTPDPDYNFKGWYEDDTLVSSSTNYTFTATYDRRLEARVLYKDATFDPYNPPEPAKESEYLDYEGKLIETWQIASGRFISIEIDSGRSSISLSLQDDCVITINGINASFESLSGELYVKLQYAVTGGYAARITATTQGSSSPSSPPSIVIDGDFVLADGVLLTYNGEGGHVVIPYGVTSIGDRVFEGCKDLTGVTIPNSVTSIGEVAFRECESLTSITIPNSVTSIGSMAFLDCKNLTNVTMPNSITSIDAAVFMYCTSLTSVTIPNGVTSIGTSAFLGCENLTSLTIPASVTSIGEHPFSLYNRSEYNSYYYNIPNLIIYGVAGSYIEKYAKENDIPFVIAQPSTDNKPSG